MARKRRPVRCRNCGYVTIPVSGFCPNCLERLPLGMPVALLPIVAVAGVLALAAVVVAASTDLVPLGPVLGRASPSSPATSATASPTVALVVSPSPVASPSLTVSPSPSGVQSSPTPTVSPSTAASPSPTQSPAQTVVGSQNPPGKSPNLPSTATSTHGTVTGSRRY
jgi:hypothetical protein